MFDFDPWEAFLSACASGNVSGVLEAIAQGGSDFVRRQAEPRVGGGTGLMVASAHGHEDVVRELLKAGADVLATDGLYRMCALHYAAHRGNAAVVALLLGNNLSGSVGCSSASSSPKSSRQAVYIVDSAGETPLGVCVAGFEQIVTPSRAVVSSGKKQAKSRGGRSASPTRRASESPRMDRKRSESNASLTDAIVDIAPDHAKCLELLLDANANPLFCGARADSTPLDKLARGGLGLIAEGAGSSTLVRVLRGHRSGAGSLTEASNADPLFRFHTVEVHREMHDLLEQWLMEITNSMLEDALIPEVANALCEQDSVIAINEMAPQPTTAGATATAGGSPGKTALSRFHDLRRNDPAPVVLSRRQFVKYESAARKEATLKKAGVYRVFGLPKTSTLRDQLDSADHTAAAY
ncbi:unnamed protein product [Amoebophrya sp. A25]|nr:unnamed protein product [Amoebophrya sp. A25]|eukprot:GSA25T00006187001.1